MFQLLQTWITIDVRSTVLVKLLQCFVFFVFFARSPAIADNSHNIYTSELSQIKIAALCTLVGGGERGGATSQVFVAGTNVNKTEDHNHLNPNHEQRFKK
jgi:hypothetical protein